MVGAGIHWQRPRSAIGVVRIQWPTGIQRQKSWVTAGRGQRHSVEEQSTRGIEGPGERGDRGVV